MTVASVDRVQINLLRQGAIDGTTLASAKTIANKGKSHTFTPDRRFALSEVSRADYQGGTNVPIGYAGRGGWPFSLAYFHTDQGMADVVRSLLKSGAPTAATTQITGVTTTADGGATNIAFSGGSGNVETGIEAGDVVRVLDSGNVLLGFARVLSIDAGGHTITTEYTTTIPDGVNRKVLRGARYKNGTTKDYIAVEAAMLDPGVYWRCKNWIPTAMRFGFGSGRAGIVGSIEGVGTHLESALVQYSSSLVADTVNPIFTPKVDARTTIFRLGTTALQVLEASCDITHPADLAEIATSNFGIDIVPGTFAMSGSLTTYLDTNARFELLKNASATSLLKVFRDESAQAISFSWPVVRLSGLNPSSAGTSLTEQISWLAESDNTLGTIRVQSFAT